MGKRSHMFLFVALFAGAILVAVGVGWFAANKVSRTLDSGSNGPGYNPPVLEKRQIHLYFGDQQGQYLKAEQEVIDQPADAATFGRRILEALLEGPGKGTTPTLPEGASLRAFHILGEGVAYVDFSTGSFDGHPGGVESELLSIYSIVNTLVLNVEEIRSVKFLIGGKEAATLAGHVDLSSPFKADMLWVR